MESGKSQLTREKTINRYFDDTDVGIINWKLQRRYYNMLQKVRENILEKIRDLSKETEDIKKNQIQLYD